jgi:hypothetical protein
MNRSLLLLLFLAIAVFPCSATAQQYQRVEGTGYFLVQFPNGDVALGQKINGEIALVSEEDALATLKKRVVADKKMIKGFQKVLRGKPVKVPKGKFFKPLKKIVKGARDGISGAERARVLATRRRLKNRRKINQRAINQIKQFFIDKLLPPIDTFRDTFLHRYTDGSGIERWVYGVYVGFKLPRKYKNASAAIVCASFSGDPDEPHRGAQMPFESQETITNDPCDRAVLFGGVNCPGILGQGILASVLSASNGYGNGPSPSVVQAVLANAGSNTHQFRYKTRKVKCLLK